MLVLTSSKPSYYEYLYLCSFDGEGKIFLYRSVEHKLIPNSVPTWAWFSADNKIAEIYRLEGRMDTNQYIHLLSAIFSEVAVSQPQQAVNFVHDHHPVHGARVVKQWLRDRDFINVLPWPKNFGFVMPMESLWSDMLVKLEGISVSSTEELWEIVSSCFVDLCTNDYLKKLSDQIPHELNNLLDNQSMM